MASVARVLKPRAIVPYFGGTSDASHSLVETRLDYLAKTIASLDALDIDSAIFVANAKDAADTWGKKLDTEPRWLPYAACTWMQQHPRACLDLVYYTEADQVLHVHDEEVFGIPDDERYLAPWRLDAIGPQGEREMEGSATIDIDGTLYGISNGGHRVPRGEEGEDRWGVVDFRSQQQSFSGAWLATRDLFLQVPFRKMRNLPVEHASGFDIKSVSECVRTAWVERCWIEHLSPRDRYLNPQESEALV